MKKISLFLFLLLSFSSLASDCLSDVNTRVTDEGRIEITYTLTSSDPTNTFPVFSINFTGEIAGKKSFALKTLEGAGKTGVLLGEGTYTSIWNVAKDCKRNDPNTIKINVDAEEVTDEAKYLCLNLKTFKMRCQNDPPDVTKSTCKTKELWLRRIEPGTFTMGSPTNELGRSDNETQHEVTLTKAFYIGVFETTQKQFKAITGYNFSGFKGATRPVEDVSYDMLRGDAKGSGWPSDCEVDEECSFEIYKGFNRKTYESKYKIIEAPTFFHTLRNKTGNTFLFDLPTEAQWEYACRAGTATALNSGKDLLSNTNKCFNLDEVGRNGFNGGYDFQKWKSLGHAKVGSYLPNKWGLYDMHGNVDEWCLDWYQEDLSNDPVNDPKGGDFGRFRVCRGGCYYSYPVSCRSACRGYSTPDSRFSSGGFRVALVQNVDQIQIKRDFEFDIEPLTEKSLTENTLPVFKVKLYGKLKDGTKYSLEEMGKIEYDGASGIVLGYGKHKLTWIPNDAYTNLINEVELEVEYEDVTSEAEYLVLDLHSYKMRTSVEGPELYNPECYMDELWLKRIKPGTYRREKDVITLTKAFYIGVFETTQFQFETVTGINPSYYLGKTRPVERVSYINLRGNNKGSEWPKSNEVDESSFFGFLRKRAGNIFDLPTEAQWEYACGGWELPDDPYSVTNSYFERQGRYHYNKNDGKGLPQYKEHTRVGSYEPFRGLYDMHGNVCEWCLDWYDEYGSNTNDPVGAASGKTRVLHGGGWNYAAFACFSGYRYNEDPSYCNTSYGFRTVLVSVPYIQLRKDFKFEVSSGGDNTLPVFKVKLYGKLKDGTKYPLEEMGKIEYDGASGIVLGYGKHEFTWFPSAAYTNLIDEVELVAEYEDVTSEAAYLVLDLMSGKMRVSSEGPNVSDDICRTDEIWFRRIEPGSFTMGSPKNELGRSSDETQHEVTHTKAYYIGVFEVTQKQYELITGTNPSKYKGALLPVEQVSYEMLRGTEAGSKWPLNNKVDESSVLGQLRKRIGNVFDLPTEAQWEYACRAGTTTALNSGKDLTNADSCANMDEVGRYKYNQNDGNSEGNEHTTVGSYLPNSWGLYDMHGNVKECCLDYYKKDLGSNSVTDPTWIWGSDTRVVRGGCWFVKADKCRSASRDTIDADAASSHRGFRLVLVLPYVKVFN